MENKEIVAQLHQAYQDQEQLIEAVQFLLTPEGESRPVTVTLLECEIENESKWYKVPEYVQEELSNRIHIFLSAALASVSKFIELHDITRRDF